MKVMKTRIVIIVSTLLLAGTFSGPSEAWRRQPEPPPLETTFEAVGARVEAVDGATMVTFGDRVFRLSTVAEPEGALRTIVEGDGRWYSALGKKQVWRSGDIATRAMRRSPNEVWLLPGYGFIIHWPRQDRDGRQSYDREIIRGSDGTVNPPGASREGFSDKLDGFVRRAGIQANPLFADRTFFINGSPELTPEATSRAWLFDAQGAIEQWSPLVDVGGVINLGNWRQGRKSMVYQRVSDQGHVTFGTPGEDGTIDLHVLSPDLKAVATHPGSTLIKLRPDNPENVEQNKTAVEGVAFEPHFPNPVLHKTALIVPAEGHPGVYRLLEDDGRLTSPGQSVGFIPMTRRPSDRHAGTSRAARPRFDDRPLATGFLLVYETETGMRYGWASSEFSHHTGPIWRDARIIQSPRLAYVGVGLITQILVAQTDEGFWRSFVEPVLHDPDSVWNAPNSFDNYLPPASTAEEVALMAERVLEHRERVFRESYKQEWLQVTAVSRAQARANREALQQERRRRMGEKAAFWQMIGQGVSGGLSERSASYEASQPNSGPRPSALGPDFYWEGGALIHRPSGRRVD